MRKSGSAPIASLTRGDGPPLLNYSQIAEWNRCRYRYNLSTLRHIQSRGVIRALDMGSAAHVGMEAGIRAWAEWKSKKGSAKINADSLLTKAIDRAVLKWSVEQVELRGGREQLAEEEILLMDSILADAPRIAKRCLDNLNMERWKTLQLGGHLGCELEIQIPFPGWGGFHMTLDWVAEDLQEGGVWVFDYKFREAFTPAEAEEVNMQLAIYQHGLRAKHGIETAGSIMFQGRSKLPAQPSLNKNGTMSRARVATDWETYKAALKSAKLDPNDYQEEMQPKLDYEFFRFDRFYRSPEEVEAVWHYAVRPAGLIMLRDRSRSKRMYRNLGQLACGGCWAREFCLTELRNEDTDFLLKTRFIDLDNPQERLVLAPEDLVIED